MRQTRLELREDDRLIVERVRDQGVHHTREINRAHVLWCLDHGVPESQIMAVLGIGRAAVWRARATYLHGGLDLALFDVARPGRPRKYDTAVEAQVTALACSSPPVGRRRWTLVELERAARRESGMADLSRETVRRMRKKSLS